MLERMEDWGELFVRIWYILTKTRRQMYIWKSQDRRKMLIMTHEELLKRDLENEAWADQHEHEMLARRRREREQEKKEAQEKESRKEEKEKTT